MLKPQKGLSYFKPEPDAPCQVCLVCGVNEDGTVNLIAFDEVCEVRPKLECVVVQKTDECEAHYAPKPDEPKGVSDGKDEKVS